MAVLRPGRLVFGRALLAGASLLFSASPPPVPGAPMSAISDGDIGLRINVERFELAPITSEELAGSSARPQPAPPMKSWVEGRRLRAEGGLQVSPLTLTIERELPAVWEYRRPVGETTGALPRVRVELEGTGGFALQARTSGPATMPVRVRPSRISRRPGGDGIEVFSGGVILEIPVAALAQAGRYRARLHVSIESH